jgi:hypothetical protein
MYKDIITTYPNSNIGGKREGPIGGGRRPKWGVYIF